MAQLKSVLEGMGFSSVKTLLASGNVIFETKKENETQLAKKISAKLEDVFGFSVPVIVRLMDDIERIVSDDPFSKITVTNDTRLYVTFIPDSSKSTLKFPHTTPDGALRILGIRDNMLLSVLDVSKKGTVDAMAIIEKEFGKQVTTRDWNTLVKMVS